MLFSHYFFLCFITTGDNFTISPTFIFKFIMYALWFNELYTFVLTFHNFRLNFYILPECSYNQLISNNELIIQYLNFNCEK